MERGPAEAVLVLSKYAWCELESWWCRETEKQNIRNFNFDYDFIWSSNSSE